MSSLGRNRRRDRQVEDGPVQLGQRMRAGVAALSHNPALYLFLLNQLLISPLFFPSLPEPRKRSEKALLAVVQTAYGEGVSTRKVDDVLEALGLTGIDKSKVSRLCRDLDKLVEAFRTILAQGTRKLEGEFPNPCWSQSPRTSGMCQWVLDTELLNLVSVLSV